MRNIFSERLRTLRAQKDMTSLAMADFLEFSQPVYSRYENGRVPDVNTVAAIAERCGVTVDWLLGRADAQRPVAPAPLASASGVEGCRCPSGVDERLDAMEQTLAKMAGQLETVTGLLGNALAPGLGIAHSDANRKHQPRKAG